MKNEIIKYGKYTLSIQKRRIKEGCWKIADIQVHDKNKLIWEGTRNYSSVPHAFVLDHPSDGNDYLLISLKYYSQGLLNLTTGEYFEGVEGNGNYCQTQYNVSPCKKYVIVISCYWGGSYYTECFDFVNPKILQEHNRIWINDEFDRFIEFTDGKVKLGCERTYDTQLGLFGGEYPKDVAKRNSEYFSRKETGEDMSKVEYPWKYEKDVVLWDLFALNQAKEMPDFEWANGFEKYISRPLFEKGQYFFED